LQAVDVKTSVLKNNWGSTPPKSALQTGFGATPQKVAACATGSFLSR
jgi:hypothetical protein